MELGNLVLDSLGITYFSPNPGNYCFPLNLSVSSKEVTYLSNNDMLYIKYDTVVPIRFNWPASLQSYRLIVL